MIKRELITYVATDHGTEPPPFIESNLWYDTSTSPPIVKICHGEEWIPIKAVSEKNYCKTCSHRDDNNYCTSPKLVEADYYKYDNAIDMLVYSYSEGGEFKVGDNFGCVHHKEKE